MNDRYLYRAKRIDNGEWVEGFYAVARYRKGLTQHNILIADNDLGYFKWIVVDPSTVCQCTGLKDKNGKLIWENDIVAYHFGKTCAPICFGSYQSCFDNTKTEHVGFYVNWNDKCNYRKDLGYWINMIEADVVGNIFDNTELLEVKE